LQGPSPPFSLRAGDLITPSLELVRPLGAGGMGHVWVAHHRGLRTEVVVKFMSDHLSTSPEAVSRFSREAAAASQVKSPHVVQMLDHGLTYDGRLYIAMELMDGVDLAGVLAQRGTLRPDEVVTIVTHVCRALAKAHERGIIHRDIKPDNIFLVDAGGGELFAKVLDFGIAKSTLSAPGTATTTGSVLGTPYYMSPEQVLGKPIDATTDIWALGVVAYECLTGAVPFAGDTVGALSIAICHETIVLPTMRNGALPDAVDTWFLRACARDRSERFSGAMEVADALRAALSQPARPASMTAADASGSQRAIAPRRPTTGGAVSREVPAFVAPPRRRKWIVPAVIAASAVAGTLVGVVSLAVSRGSTGAATDEEPAEPRKPRSKPRPTAAAPTMMGAESASVSASFDAATEAPVPSASTTLPSVKPTAVPAAPVKKKDVVLE
jgi:serine/threonine protein kinase